MPENLVGEAFCRDLARAKLCASRMAERARGVARVTFPRDVDGGGKPGHNEQAGVCG
jgi:hypothetical protein